jgi:23S rRNA (cytidine2498-2'-O)-methyltransferase
LLIAAADSKDALQRELFAALPGTAHEIHSGLFACEFEVEPARLPYLAFARQLVPYAREVEAESIRAWATVLVDAVAGVLPDQATWALHIYPFKELAGTTRMGARAWHTRTRTGQPRLAPPSEHAPRAAGSNRCQLIHEAVSELLEKRRRQLLRHLRPGPGLFVEDETLVQLVLTSPERGFLSTALAPFPFEQRHVLSGFPGGQIAPASDKRAPSRAFTKLVEAELRFGRRIVARDTCVDLGASPGSWTYVAAQRGARVTAVDRAPLRSDLLEHRCVRFQRGDAFRFEPAAPVDWLLCDVIAAAERSAELLLRWLRARWCRHFVVTLKVDDVGSGAVLSELKRLLPELTSEFWLLRLCANKKEVCAFGTLA